MSFVRGPVAVVAVLMALASCAESDPAPTAPTAASLAPSQVTASTVARPATPPPCDPTVLDVAATAGADQGMLAVVSIVNSGEVWCEVDVFDSPSVDPLMEPDVWLEPGQRAELLVEAEAECAATTTYDSIALVMNGLAVDVPICNDISMVCGMAFSRG